MNRRAQVSTLGASRYRRLSPGPGSPADQVAIDQRTRIQSAMIELVGEGGYEAVTLRQLTALAGVSIRTFYDHFEGKEECFLRTYELVTQRIAARVTSAQAGESDWSRRLELGFQAFAAELVNRRRAARLALLEIFAVGPAPQEAMGRAEARFEEKLTESFLRSRPQKEVSPLLARAVLAGAAFVARTRIIGAGPTEAAATASELSQWALSLQDMPASVQLSPAPARANLPPARSEPGEREVLLAATAKLAATNGYRHLTMPRILAAAGLRKNRFTSQFTGVEECFLAVLKQRTIDLIDRSMSESRNELPAPDRVRNFIENLCAAIATDRVTAKLVFVEVQSAGRPAVALQDALLTNLAGELLRHPAGLHGRPISPLGAEASIAAIWGIFRNYVSSGREGQLPKLASTLTFLLLASGADAH